MSIHWASCILSSHNVVVVAKSWEDDVLIVFPILRIYVKIVLNKIPVTIKTQRYLATEDVRLNMNMSHSANPLEDGW